MLNFFKKYSIILQIVVLFAFMSTFTGCGNEKETPEASVNGTVTDETVNSNTPASDPVETKPASSPTPSPEPVYIDYAAELKLDMNSDTAKTAATVYAFVDGDTVHFRVPTSVVSDGVLKARFLAIDTPESTGKIQEYGKAASNFTKEKLSKATSILLESDNGTWNFDSTGSRYLVWIWYKTDENEEYRNLNLEILQNGLAIGSGSTSNRYGEICGDAVFNAQMCKLMLFSGEPDPDFYYGDAFEITLKQLRLNIESDEGKKVAFEGVVTQNTANTAYVEEYDPETGLYNGITVYYGTGLSGTGIEILSIGNRVRIVGSCVYWLPTGQTEGHYQITDVNYKIRKPKDPGNIQKLDEEVHSVAYAEIDGDLFASGSLELSSESAESGEMVSKTYSIADLIQYTTVTISDLDVVRIQTTTNAESSQKGAMTLTCKTQSGETVSVRTSVLYDDNHELITAEQYEGCNISVKGIVECYDSGYQIKVSSKDHIIINH